MSPALWVSLRSTFILDKIVETYHHSARLTLHCRQSTTAHMTNPTDDAPDTNTAAAADLAAQSGLFGAPKQPAPAKPQAKTPSTAKRNRSHNAPPKTQPLKAQGVKSTDSGPDVQDSDDLGQQALDVYWSEQSIYRRIKQAITDKLDRRSNSMLLLSSRETAQRIDRLLREADDLRAKLAALTHTPAAIEGGSEPPTREELIGIISQAVRRPDGTGADIKGLTATLQSLLPDLFRDESNDRKPDPCAVLSYVVSFAGMTGPEIIQGLGGRDFVRDTLVDILKTAVVLPDPVQ